MKKILFFCIFAILSFSAFSQKQLTSFEQIIDALKSGKQVKVVIFYADCQLISDNKIEEKSPNAIGGMDINTYEYFAKGSVYNKLAFLATSKTKLIENPIGKGYVYNYVKIKISEDNNVRIIARYLNPKTYEEIMDESFYTEINNTKNNGAAFFYTKK